MTGQKSPIVQVIVGTVWKTVSWLKDVTTVALGYKP